MQVGNQGCGLLTSPAHGGRERKKARCQEGRVIRSRNIGKIMHSSRERGPLWLCRPAAGPRRGQVGVSCMLMPGDLGTGNGAGITQLIDREVTGLAEIC